MNIDAPIAVMSSRKWFASPKRTKALPAHPARAGTQKRRSRFLHRMEAHPSALVLLPAAVAAPVAASPDRGDLQTGREPVFSQEVSVTPACSYYPRAVILVRQMMLENPGMIHIEGYEYASRHVWPAGVFS
jgi:hypothetical protein